MPDTRCSSSGPTNWPVHCSISFVKAVHLRSQHARNVAPGLSPVRWIAQAVEAGLTQHQHSRLIAHCDERRRAGRIERDRDLAEQLPLAEYRHDPPADLRLDGALQHEA